MILKKYDEKQDFEIDHTDTNDSLNIINNEIKVVWIFLKDPRV